VARVFDNVIVRIVAAVFAVALVAVVAHLADADLTVAALLLLVGVVIVGALGFESGIAAAIAAFLLLNWFFTQPTGSLKIHRTDDLVALIVFGVCAVLVGAAVQRLSSLTRNAQRREAETQVRLDLTNRLLGGEDVDEVLGTAARALCDVFGFRGCRLRAGDFVVTAGTLGDAPELHAEATGITLVASSPHALRAGDRAQLDALLAGLATAIDRVRLQHEVAEARVAEEVSRQRAVLLAAVSHNLRTPLTSVKAAAESLQTSWSRLSEDERRELLGTISGEADRLERVVRNTLELTRIRAGGVEVAREPVDLAELVGHAVRRLRPIIRAHEVRIDVAPDLPDVWVDVMMIEQILLNLLENALSYAPSGTEILVCARAVDCDHVELGVVDHGPGVPAAARERIFEEFLGAESRPDRPGIGLGLAIVRALIGAQGGTVRYEETPGGGATFVCTLPVR
jgi:two-component system sensor histidine kinase KdpD